MCKDLHVCVMDFDLLSADDLIGETVIDLENRFLTRHRATVGLASSFCTSGVCRWRDCKLPSEILAEFCAKQFDMIPDFTDDDTLEIGSATYTLAEFGELVNAIRCCDMILYIRTFIHHSGR